MYMFIFMAAVFVLVAFSTVAKFSRGNWFDAVATGIFFSALSPIPWLVFTAIATNVSDAQRVEQWEVQNLQKNNNGSYSYTNNGIFYDYDTSMVNSDIAVADDGQPLRQQVCGKTPDHMLPFGDFGDCHDYLYVPIESRP